MFIYEIKWRSPIETKWKHYGMYKYKDRAEKALEDELYARKTAVFVHDNQTIVRAINANGVVEDWIILQRFVCC